MSAFISVPTTPIFSNDSVVRRRQELVAFTWGDETHEVIELIRFWEEKSPSRFRRSGRSDRWHISPHGREYYRVKTAGGRYFDLYNDRQVMRRQVSGRWILWRELTEQESTTP